MHVALALVGALLASILAMKRSRPELGPALAGPSLACFALLAWVTGCTPPDADTNLAEVHLAGEVVMSLDRPEGTACTHTTYTDGSRETLSFRLGTSEQPATADELFFRLGHFDGPGFYDGPNGNSEEVYVALKLARDGEIVDYADRPLMAAASSHCVVKIEDDVRYEGRLMCSELFDRQNEDAPAGPMEAWFSCVPQFKEVDPNIQD